MSNIYADKTAVLLVFLLCKSLVKFGFGRQVLSQVTKNGLEGVFVSQVVRLSNITPLGPLSS